MTGRIIQLSGGIAALSVVFVLTLAGIARADGTEACGFSGPDISCVFTQYPGEQAFEIPPGVRHVTIEAIGAPGGRGYTTAAGASGAGGGSGARVIAPVTIPDGVDTLYVEVGGPGGAGAPQSPGAGGYNGGGIGGAAVPGSGGGGGGGASDVRTCSIAATACPGGGDSLRSRLVVAAGGGGGGAGGGGFGDGFISGGTGGDAVDGLTADGSSGGTVGSGGAAGGGGATTARGGVAGNSVCPEGSGRAGVVGSGGAGGAVSCLNEAYDGGGGGAGLFGGGGAGGGTLAGAGGGAGSSFGPDGTAFSSATDSTEPEVRITYSTDTTPPAITISAPAQDATYNEAQAVDAAYSCSDDGVGVASCAGSVAAGHPLDTTTPGTHAFTVTATDNTGNQSTQTVTYNVQVPPVTLVTPNPPINPNPPASPNPPVGQSSPATPGTPTTPATPRQPAQGHPPTSLLAFANTESPTISGPRLVGRVLIASPGKWSRNARLHYQWKRCSAAGTHCREVMHATGRTYRLTSADIGYKVTVTVSAIDAHGHRASATPRPVGPIDRPSRRRGPNH